MSSMHRISVVLRLQLFYFEKISGILWHLSYSMWLHVGLCQFLKLSSHWLPVVWMALESTPPVTKNNLVTNQFSARRRDQKRDDHRLYKKYFK